MECSTAYGHTVTMTSYRHAAHHVIWVLNAAGFTLHTDLHRSPEGAETTHRAVLLARRRWTASTRLGRVQGSANMPICRRCL